MLGFDAFGIVAPDAIPNALPRLQEFLDDGAHGDMAWLAANPERRADPRTLWSDVRSIVMLGVNYGPDEDPLQILTRRDRGAISTYARGDDYHELIKSRLKALARWMVANAGGDVKVFVDTAAVMEKPLSEAAGLGWQGKHTNLVSREFGSWLFLGSIFTTLDLPRDASDENHCGSCRACLDACPTDAFPSPYRLDARRCISYLTIEHKGPIPREFRKAIGNRIYGCDDCLAVCPWNKFAQQGREMKLRAREELRAPSLADLSRLDDAAFRALVFQIAGEADRPRPLHPQCADRHRQLQRRRTRRSTPNACSTTRARWCGARRPGRSRNCCQRGCIRRGSRSAQLQRESRPDRSRRVRRCKQLANPHKFMSSHACARPARPLDFLSRSSMVRRHENRALLHPDGDRFLPTSAGRSPWDPKFMHGRIVVGLLGQEIERRHGGPDYMPSRLTVDMYRLPDFSPSKCRRGSCATASASR